ncbi:sialidase family protein [Pontiella sulfatireligans]|uniref:Sialidase domain-containing protein n=1 Tax=Pontiella sulfatireligans TaxID=2750658 RepID=A0A6C2US48_9BACT|nr:sialidase family protein [Pontiella sulfatireligans]VGO22084.1 hypothetical protein SCARR_04165 [Pontiella sulfatireligans]
MNLKFLMPVCILLAAGIVRAEKNIFLNPPEYIGPPTAQYASTNRAHQGIPSIAVAPGGRLWATWYAGVTPKEDLNNYVILATSGDGGSTWEEVLVVNPDGPGPVRAFDPELWMAPDGKLRWFWAQTVGHDGSVAGVWELAFPDPDDGAAVYEPPRRLTDGVMMCKPIVLSSGKWVLPASTWRNTDDSARMVVSSDQGQTWSIRGACNVPLKTRKFDEHMIVERSDESLWMLARTTYGMGESVSTDRGKTWPDLKPAPMAHASSRFYITQLKSGNILLVKHAAMHEKAGRSLLMAFLSTDDGKTWSDGLMLDERKMVSYPDGQQGEDGVIRVIYDYQRTDARQILMAEFREEDVAAGKNVSGSMQLRRVVSQATGGQTEPPPVPQQARSNSDGAKLKKTPAGSFVSDGCEQEVLSVRKRLFADRGYAVANLPAALENVSVLHVPMEGIKEATCSAPGMLYFLTPQPDRNKASQARLLEDKGFKKVAVPEIPLFNPDVRGNFCSLYQKECAANEVIRFGKWAVPLFFSDAE